MGQPVAVFDIDGTIIRSSLVIELTHELIEQGVFPEAVHEEFEAEKREWLNRHGDYETYLDKLVDTYENYTTGCREDEVAVIAREVARRHTYQTYRYTRKLVERLKTTHCLLAISGSPIEVVEPFAKAHGFELAHATIKETRNGVYLDERTPGGQDKDQALLRFVEAYDLTLEASVGVGDTGSDAGFLELVDHPIAFNPNAELYNIARDNGWEIVVERKDMVYRLMPNQKGEYVATEAD